MMSELSRRFLVLLAMAVCVALAACRSAPTRVYSLYTVPPSVSIAAYAGPPLRVDAVVVPPDLDRQEILIGVVPGELKISDLDHWSAPLGQMAKNALSADLVARLPPGRVIFPHLAKPAGALGVSVDILDFKADADHASLEASWAYATDAADATGAGPQGSARLEARTREATPAAIAQSLSALLGQLADRIVAGLPMGSVP